MIDAALLLANEQPLGASLEAELLTVAQEEGPFSGYAQSTLLESNDWLFSPDLPAAVPQALQNSPGTNRDDLAMSDQKNMDAGYEDYLQISPNPATQFVTIKVDDAYSAVPLELIDAQGKVLLSTVLAHQQTIDLQGLPKGLVIVRLQLPDRFVFRKLIIQ